MYCADELTLIPFSMLMIIFSIMMVIFVKHIKYVSDKYIALLGKETEARHALYMMKIEALKKRDEEKDDNFVI